MIKKILDYIGAGKTEKAIIELRRFLSENEPMFDSLLYKEFYSKIILLSNRYHEKNNTLERSESIIELSKIVHGLIELCFEIEKNFNSINLEKNQFLPKTRVDFVMNGNLNEFSTEKRNLFRDTIINLLDIHEGEFEIKLIKKGSIIVSADIPTEKLGLLYKLRDIGVLKNYANIVDSYLSGEKKDDKSMGEITYTTISAFAGSTIGQEEYESVMKFSIPGIKGKGMVAFQIDGNSMDPVIQHNDIVVCKKIDNYWDIQDNKIYAVRSHGNIWVKYVQKIMNKRGRLIKLKLISANYFDHDPFEENLGMDTTVFEVVRIIKKTDKINS